MGCCIFTLSNLENLKPTKRKETKFHANPNIFLKLDPPRFIFRIIEVSLEYRDRFVQIEFHANLKCFGCHVATQHVSAIKFS